MVVMAELRERPNSGFFFVFCAVGVGLTRSNPTRYSIAKAQRGERTAQNTAARPCTQQRPAVTTPHPVTTSSDDPAKATHTTPHPTPARTANGDVNGERSFSGAFFLFFSFFCCLTPVFDVYSFFYCFSIWHPFLFLTPIFFSVQSSFKWLNHHLMLLLQVQQGKIRQTQTSIINTILFCLTDQLMFWCELVDKHECSWCFRMFDLWFWFIDFNMIVWNCLRVLLPMLWESFCINCYIEIMRW